MDRSKKDAQKCLIWIRNGICFCFTWLVFLGMALCRINKIETVSVNLLFRLFLLVCGGVLIFCFWFSPFPLKKMRFFSRLTGFFIIFVPYEIMSFFIMGFFKRSGTTLPKVLIFLSIALAFYLICLFIDRFVCAREGVKYTEDLKKYQR